MTEQHEPEQTQPEQTDFEQPASEHDAPEQPASEQPASEQPASEQPASEQPASEQPASEQGAPEQRAAPDESGESHTGNSHTGNSHTEGSHAEERAGVRGESWSCSGPAELDLSVEVGRIEVTLAEGAASVSVELHADEQSSWAKGLSGLLNWLGEATGPAGSIRIGDKHINIGGREFAFGGREFPFGGLGGWWDRAGWGGGGEFDLHDLAGRDLPSDAVAAAEITWEESARRLLVRSPTVLPLRLLPLTARVSAPAGSRLTLRTGGGTVTVTGRAGSATVRTGSGDVSLDAVDGDVVLTTGSGTANVGAVAGSTRAKSGSGDLSLASVAGSAQVSTGSGDVRIGVVRADLLAKTGSGDLTVADAESGELRLTTGSGDLRVGVHAGVAAMLDLTSGSGRARSELNVSDSAPPGDGGGRVTVHGRTGSGDVLVTRALSAAGAT